MEFVWSMSAHS